MFPPGDYVWEAKSELLDRGRGGPAGSDRPRHGARGAGRAVYHADPEEAEPTGMMAPNLQESNADYARVYRALEAQAQLAEKVGVLVFRDSGTSFPGHLDGPLPLLMAVRIASITKRACLRTAVIPLPLQAEPEWDRARRPLSGGTGRAGRRVKGRTGRRTPSRCQARRSGRESGSPRQPRRNANRPLVSEDLARGSLRTSWTFWAKPVTEKGFWRKAVPASRTPWCTMASSVYPDM